VVRFREFPFGSIDDPSMRDFMAAEPRPCEDKVLEYLRSGYIFAYPMGADLTDWFGRTRKANVLIEGKVVGGTTPMTDGVWFWPAGLIHFIERYHVPVPQEFIDHAARNNWRVNTEVVREGVYDCDY
jgi:hypothetical protein